MKRTRLKRGKGLSPMSDKRKRERAVYMKLRATLLSERPVCEVCETRPSTECHHKAKRGKNYLNAETFMAVCRTCHRWIEDNLAEARKRGYLE